MDKDSIGKEDFEKFVEGLQETIDYIKTNCLKDVPERPRKDSGYDDFGNF